MRAASFITLAVLLASTATAKTSPEIKEVCPVAADGRRAVIFAGGYISRRLPTSPITCPTDSVPYEFKSQANENDSEPVTLKKRTIIHTLCHGAIQRGPNEYFLGWLGPDQNMDDVQPETPLFGNFTSNFVYQDVPSRSRTPIQLRANFEENLDLIKAAPDCSWLATWSDFSRKVTVRVETVGDTVKCSGDERGATVQPITEYRDQEVPDPEGGYVIVKSETGQITEMLTTDIPDDGLVLGHRNEKCRWEKVKDAGSP